MNKYHLFSLLVILVMFIAGTILYPDLPDEMASHWNSQGEVNGYMSKFWGVYGIPIINLILIGLLIIIPKIDPKKANIQKFISYYRNFMTITVLFLGYIYALVLAFNLGYIFNMTKLILPSIAIIIYYMGILLGKSKQNWFIGIKTPWTLSSKKVWDKTHKKACKLYKISAILIFLAAFLPENIILFVILPIILSTLYLVIYSYQEYKKEKR